MTRPADRRDIGAAAPQTVVLEVARNILAHNDDRAAEVRARLAARQIFAVNLMSGPGSGKTSLLCRSLAELLPRIPCAVIEGDQQTANDAERIRAVGAPAVQVNTGKGCHLDAVMVDMALARLALPAQSLLFIENVGNLVCPAAFDLGESCRVALLAVTEGEDKPLKYPDMFQAAQVMLINKIDLLPYVDFDLAACIANVRKVNPTIRIFALSALTGEGMGHWLDWLAGERARLIGRC